MMPSWITPKGHRGVGGIEAMFPSWVRPKRSPKREEQPVVHSVVIHGVVLNRRESESVWMALTKYLEYLVEQTPSCHNEIERVKFLVGIYQRNERA